ncbi:MAG: DUF255 domain-containing protein [Bacteroidetes bacterium]|nr:DUF255 domain-containing protein [Bacteroidota bacterium]
MRRVLTIATALVLIFSAESFNVIQQQPELKWEGWNSGYKRGISENKIILVDAYTDWCGWCKKMDRETYSDPEIIKKINKHFVAIKFNPELNQTYYIDTTAYTGRELHAMLSKEYRTGYPTTYFILPQNNKLFINPGYEDPQRFSETLDKMVAEAGLK